MTETKQEAFAYVADASRHGSMDAYLEGIIGPAFGEYRRAWYRASKERQDVEFPLYLSIESMMRCNYRCAMCTFGRPEELKDIVYPEVLSDAMYQSILDEVGEHYCPSAGLNMVNEPLLDKRMPDMIAGIMRAGVIDSRINTNGSLLTADTARRLIDAGLVRLYVGLDAATPETYAKMRIGGDYDKVMRNVMTFLDIREKMGVRLPILRVSFVKTSINEIEVEAFHALWGNVADMVSIQEYMPPYMDSEGLAKHAKTKRIPADYSCPQPFERLGIKGNGDVHPCCAQFNYKIKAGSLHESSLHTIWHAETMRRLRDSMRANTWRAHPVCNACLTNSYLYGG
ncbi:MAG: radical SAM protein [Desulfovibrionaceae bacterium]